MNPASLTWLVIGGILAYAVAVDPNVYHWVELQVKVVRIWFRRQWFLIRHNPDNPWVKFQIDRNADKIAKQLIKERESND
jgi:hypothetical protein